MKAFFDWLKANATKSAGYLTVVVAMIESSPAKNLIFQTPESFSLFVLVIGLVVAGIGHFNTTRIVEAAVDKIVAKKEGGFARLVLLVVLASIALFALAGCAATRGAYQAAEDPEEVAFVISEHYNAVLTEAAGFVEASDTPQQAKDAIKSVSSQTTPVVLELRGLAEAFKAAEAAVMEAEEADAEDLEAVAAARAQLSAATAKAAAAVANFIRALRQARGATALQLPQPPPSYWNESNFILRLERLGGAA